MTSTEPPGRHPQSRIPHHVSRFTFDPSRFTLHVPRFPPHAAPITCHCPTCHEMCVVSPRTPARQILGFSKVSGALDRRFPEARSGSIIPYGVPRTCKNANQAVGPGEPVANASPPLRSGFVLVSCPDSAGSSSQPHLPRRLLFFIRRYKLLPECDLRHSSARPQGAATARALERVPCARSCGG